MDDRETYLQAIRALAHYGLQKTSMGDLAAAVGVSRQTLYNRFKTKEAVRAWAILGFTETNLASALAALENSEITPAKALEQSFDRWLGDHVALRRNSPHGAEIMDSSAVELFEERQKHVSRFEVGLIDFLVINGVTKNRNEASIIAYCLLSSARGIVFTVSESKEFSSGMRKIISLFLR